MYYIQDHFAFVGINPDVLRILVTHPEVPHGTAVLVAYRQAESTLTTLTSMKKVDAFKPYRGRIGLLAQELERRLEQRAEADAIIDRLHKEVVKALAQPEVIRQFDIQGLEGVGSSPAEFLKFAQKESAFMNDLARKIAAAPK